MSLQILPNQASSSSSRCLRSFIMRSTRSTTIRFRVRHIHEITLVVLLTRCLHLSIHPLSHPSTNATLKFPKCSHEWPTARTESKSVNSNIANHQPTPLQARLILVHTIISKEHNNIVHQSHLKSLQLQYLKNFPQQAKSYLFKTTRLF